MKKIISIFSLFILIFFSPNIYAERMDGYNRIDYDTHIEVNEGFKSITPNYKAWKSFLEKFSAKGYVSYADLFNTQERMYSYTNIFLNNKFLLDFDYNGNQQFFWMHSNALNDTLHFNSQNYYEFMLKGYFFLNLPTQKIALLTYPFGAYCAIKPFSDFIKKHIDPIKHDTVIPYNELLNYTKQIKTFFDKEYVSYQFIRSATIESGITDLIYYDFATAEEYLASFAEGKNLEIKVNGNEKTFEIAGYQIIKYNKNEHKTDIQVSLPASPNGIEYNCNFNMKKNDDSNYDITAHVGFSMDESEYLSLNAKCENVPDTISKECQGNMYFSIGGDGLGKTDEAYFEHNIKKTGDNKYSVKISYLEPVNKQKIASLIINTSKKSYSNDVGLSTPVYYDQDFFSLNDQSLKERKESLKLYAKKVIVPILMETPPKVINDIFDIVERNGLLDVMIAK